VAVVGAGLAAVGVANAASAVGARPNGGAGEDTGSGWLASRNLLGTLLVVGQCVMSVMQDIAEEVFMDEAGFPATLLLGMEGLFGLVFGVLLYLPLARTLGEDPAATWTSLTSSPAVAWYAAMLPLLFALTGIFNIVATGVTSSMTRNVWKNLRTALVWVLSLAIYYGTANDALGEPWVVPGSFYVLGGFAVILAGIFMYYSNP
jgi:hypothetical protein